MATRSSHHSTQKSALLEGLSEQGYHRIKRSLSSSDGLSGCECDRAKHTYGDDDRLPEVLRAEIYSQVFSKLPLRLIDLRSGQRRLTGRFAVAEYLTSPEKLRAGVELVVERERGGLRGPMTVAQWDQLRDRAIADWVREATRFAVLSHTWEPGELSFHDFRDHDDLLGLRSCQHDDRGRKQSLEKLHRFCEIAEGHGTEFAWADNVCIDTSSSAELDESVRSMFTWYREAAICIAYLGQTRDFVDLVRDRWFTRGWTLQELLAPRRLRFYSKDWRPLTEALNDKTDTEHLDRRHLRDERLFRQLDLLGCAIHKATGLTMKQVCDFVPGIRSPSVPERMAWTAGRVTTREEDESYSLMGIFDVSIFVAYGEGRERAFFRLFRAILEVGYERDWFLWTGAPVSPSIHPSRMIPSSPKCYLNRMAGFARRPPEWETVRVLEREPLCLTNVGLQMRMLFVPAQVWEPGRSSCPDDPTPQALLRCPLSRGDIKIGVIRRDERAVDEPSAREEFALGFLNIDPGECGLSSPDRLYAILLRRVVTRAHGGWKRCNTDRIIVLECDDNLKIPNSEGDSRFANQASLPKTRTEKTSFWMMTL